MERASFCMQVNARLYNLDWSENTRAWTRIILFINIFLSAHKYLTIFFNHYIHHCISFKHINSAARAGRLWQFRWILFIVTNTPEEAINTQLFSKPYPMMKTGFRAIRGNFSRYTISRKHYNTRARSSPNIFNPRAPPIAANRHVI